MQQILLEEINFIIFTGTIKDPRLSNRISAVQAKMSKDLTSSVIYISAYFGLPTIQKNVNILNHARGFIQRIIAKKHKWKHTPKLFFKAVDTFSKANTVLEKIQGIASNEETSLNQEREE